VRVGTNDDLQAALDLAPQGSIVLLDPGRHQGGVRVERPVTIRGLPGAMVTAATDAPAVLTVAADGVLIEDTTLEAGPTGLVIREAQGVIVRDVRVTGSDLHGIEVIDAAAHISRVRVDGLVHPMAQGIEVRNSDGRPDTVIESSRVTGGQEGIVSHVSEVVVRDNHVDHTTMRAITITEMSDGVVKGNSITGALGAGLYCGDMSRCEFSDNEVGRVDGGSAGRSTDGWGLVVTYHAVASTEGDGLEGAAGPILASIGGHLRDDSPLNPTPADAAWVPVLGATLAAMLLAWLAYRIGRRSSPALDRKGLRRLEPIKSGGVWPLLLAGTAVQSFHMFEHGLQVFRVRIDQIPSRGGIVGPGVEAEWVHFAYNIAVFAGLGFLAVARARGWRPQGNLRLGDGLLMAALFVQGYHAIEHSAKLAQHLVGGAKVNPGFAGQVIDLVLFHYVINLTVYLSMMGAVVAYGVPTLLRMRSPAVGLVAEKAR
jgi:hypothetical protein